MRALVVLLLAIAFCVAVYAHEAHADEKSGEDIFNPPNSNVTNLDEATFDEFVKANEFVLVEFYAPWCPHCKRLVSDYEKAATLLKGKVPLAKIDCDKAKEVAQKFGVPGFPTLKLFKGGKPFRDFEEADRTGEGIAKWVERKTGPSSTTVEAAKVEEFVKKASESVAGAIVVGYFPSKDSTEYNNFRNASDFLDDFTFGEVVDASVTKPSVTLFKTHQGEADLKTQDFTNLQQYIKENGFALIDEINAKTFQRYAAAGLPLAVMFFDYKKPEQKKEVLEAMKKAAETLKGKFNFGYSDGNVYGEQLALMGGNKDKMPGLAAMNLETRKNYPFTGELKQDSVLEWANGILDGKIQPFLKSEPIPEKNDEPVKVIVGKSFDTIVMDKTKDVLLEFYAPWCGHCQKLAPKYEELAKFFSSVENLVIAKIDATQNDTPISVEGFPTIYYFPADAKEEPILYEGNRSVNDLKKFIKKNSSAAIKKQVKELLKGGDNKTETKKPKDEL